MLNIELTVELVSVIVILALMASIVFARGEIKPEPKNPTRLDSGLSNDKFILVQGWKEAELKKILNDFKENYQNDEYPPYSISIKNENENRCSLIFPDDIHPLLFIFLINYLYYPFDFNDRAVSAAGEATLNKDFQGINPILLGKKAIFYVPEDDQDKDVIYLHSKNGTTLRMSFTTMEWNEVSEPRFNKLVEKLKCSV